MTSENYGPNDFDVIPTRIEEVQSGWSLVIQHDGRAVLFQVRGKGMSYVEQQGTVFKLESEPADGGHPLRVQGPAGTIVHRLVHKG